MRRNHTRSSESGNILIYILGAIFLLGLLIVIVKGSSTPGSNIDKESLLIRVSEVQQYGEELERAVAYVMRNGHSEADIRFAHPDADSAYGDITDIPSRQIFSRDGGGAKYREAPSDVQTTPTDWSFNGRSAVMFVGTNLGGADLIAFLPYVSKDFCLLLNDKAGVINPLGDPPQDVNQVRLYHPFDGVFNFNTSIRDDATDQLIGKLEGCFEGDVDPLAGTYHYYRVLMAR